jgi:hypothetical protein
LIVWNELKGCEQDVPQLPLSEFDEVYAIDGGSTDGTVEYLESKGIAVYKQEKRGLNAAYVLANEVSTSDAVVSYFPKGTIPAAELLAFKSCFENGTQLVIASRQLPGSRNEEDLKLLKPRKWAVWSLAQLASILWRREGYMVRDVLHGVKGWTREAFDQMSILDHGLSIDIEMVVRSYKLGLRRCEFPCQESPREFGESRFPFFSTGRKLAAYLWFELRRKD